MPERQKIVKSEAANISVGDHAIIHISEETDAYHVKIDTTCDYSIRFAIPYPDGSGVCYTYWEEIVKAMQEKMAKVG